MNNTIKNKLYLGDYFDADLLSSQKNIGIGEENG